MLGGDAREKWNGLSMPDNRVTHFWDGELQVGQWFAENVEGYKGVSWDTYYLYGPNAKWETTASQAVGSGGTIFDKREALKMQVTTLLEK